MSRQLKYDLWKRGYNSIFRRRSKYSGYSMCPAAGFTPKYLITFIFPQSKESQDAAKHLHATVPQNLSVFCRSTESFPGRYAFSLLIAPFN